MKDHLGGFLVAAGAMGLLAAGLSQVPAAWWKAVAPFWPTLLLVAVSVAALVGGVAVRQRSRERGRHQPSAAPVPPDRPLRPLPSWTVAAGAVLIAGITAGAAWWLQGWFPDTVPADATQRARMRVDGIRTGLTIGAGVTAAFALLLAFRRQQLAERTQQATEYDAGEKRVTELYVKAVDQLGSEKAPVRLGGLYALERLAQDNPAHRQSIVEVLCAYLRMPYTPPGDEGTSAPHAASPSPKVDGTATRPGPQPLTAPDGGSFQKPALDPREEGQVRLTAQTILARHLRPRTVENGPNPAYWGPEVALDLTAAVLTDLDFAGCHLHNAILTRTRFINGARFGQATFGGVANLVGARFTGTASFGGATFAGSAWFNLAKFDGSVGFDKASFDGDVDFGGSTIGSGASFDEATFGGRSRFDGVRFDSGASFEGATFGDHAGFSGTTFFWNASFKGARFGSVSFVEAEFRDNAWFDMAEFRDDAWFVAATISGTASFAGATFDDTLEGFGLLGGWPVGGVADGAAR
ncbi:pentapeptide repeat-containing protein [Micromonospora sp. NPDC047074]|uniref:pentapeptide repeat-containing protein n=1 Tax=Micromonospora sp. NPDC047074 TaxID=3154339 RepID=UPI0033F5E438